MKMFGIAAVTAVTLVAAATAAAAQSVGSDGGVAPPRTVSDHSGTTHRVTAHRPSAAARSSGSFASAGAATASRARAAAIAFDGPWSVLILSREGVCNASFRYGVEIVNGNVINAGGAPVALEGHVAPNGVVRVSVAAGDQQARGVGRLSRNFGSGTWRGSGSGGFCAGVWQAERHG